jgi:hypothetical protein
MHFFLSRTLLTALFLWEGSSVPMAQNAAALRPSTAALVDSLVRIGRVTIEERQLAHPLAKQFAESAWTDELQALTRHSSPIVRVYAWMGLLGRKEVTGASLLPLVRPLWHDTVSLTIHYFNGYYRDFQNAFNAILKTKGYSPFIEPLLAFLPQEPLPENRFFLAKLLLELGKAPVRSRLEMFFAENPALQISLKAAEKGGSMYSDFLYHYNNRKD